MDAMDSAVRKVIEVPRVTIASVPRRPTLPTTHPKRRYIITPNTVSMDGVKTPPKVFKPAALFLILFLIAKNLLINEYRKYITYKRELGKIS